MIYLDAAATSAVRRDVLEAMWPYLTGDFGNPSSHHSLGETAARALGEARSAVASWLGCRASEVVFTSGGTEADNLAVKGIALANPRGRHLVTTPIEHEAVLASADHLVREHGFSVTLVPVGRDGLVDAADFAAALRPDTTLASVMLANNEVGTVQPVAELAALAHGHGILFHTDAVQAAGWLPLDVRALGVDALSVSGHKIGAPKGIGALCVRGRVPLEPVLHGGGQERGRRSGTENVAGAVGLAVAARAAAAGRDERATAARAARDAFVAAVLEAAPGAELTGHPSLRLPGTASFVFPGTSGEAVLLELERNGVVSSSGSACAAGSEDASHVLLALGYPAELARTAVRFSWGPETGAAELAGVAPEVGAAVRRVAGLRGE
ncbi:cysteine desulfurase [Leifsonia xyli subsp. cynodontis DSM 46306]|uniref:cysteine desulfurase n=1 Tax=Leifsonia xyli subsp. cynodontis DSM 46306 TaxID=1389489 RepID=U3PB23_LEIXC|nr:cysteine desulfurase family protein [Leifsonia xyli]AGW41922.1 cysteine desulfurase [Leifsonia xyli subsp. cynodontis DSM 46306]